MKSELQVFTIGIKEGKKRLGIVFNLRGSTCVMMELSFVSSIDSR